MRRITWGLIATTIVVMAATVVVLQTQGASVSTTTAARTAAAAAAPPAAGAELQPADDVAKLTAPPTPVPASTELVSLKAGSSYLLYWYNLSQPIIGELGPTTWGGPTVRPVVATKGDWLQIQLDSRPNGSTGWVRRQEVTVTKSAYRIVISVSQRSLTLYQNGWPISSAPVGVGRPQWATPTGPSFVDAIVPVPARLQYIYGPTVVITGTHSNVFTEFDGGDGTVGIHGYPSDPASTMGVASSHGCIRANPATVAAISQVPVGTPIDINP